MRSLFKRETGFYRQLWLLALPLVLQNLITTSLGFVDTFMVGLLGNHELSAVTAANAPIFLVQLIVFGLMSGLSILVSQYWGKGDLPSINRAMGVALYLGLSITAAVAAALFAAPETVMRLVTPNETLVALGAPYLRIVGVSYVFNSASSVYISMQRSTENPALGMRVFAVSMVLNTGLNYILIFGKCGAPALGVTGAAIATLASRVVEFLIVAVYALLCRRTPLLPAPLFRPGRAMLKSFARYAFPVVGNETLWGLGTAMFTVIMGHMAISTDMLAAYAIMGSIDKFSTVACIGLAGASAVIVGKRIGEGAAKEDVYALGRCLLAVAAATGLCIGALLGLLLPTFFIPALFPLFKLSAAAASIAVTMCVVYICTMPMRAFDFVSITGLLRAGGDARTALLIDTVPLWCVVIPAAAALALVLDAPVWLVCLGIQGENFFKMPLGLLRITSRRWINDVTSG